MAHRKRPYVAPNTSPPVTENPSPGHDHGGRMNDDKKAAGNVSSPQYSGGVQESPLQDGHSYPMKKKK